MTHFLFAAGFAVAAFAACSTPSPVQHLSETHVPDGSTDTRDHPIEVRQAFVREFKSVGVKFDTRFKMGAAVSVQPSSPDSADHYDVLIRPENSPINDSAWFAFKLSAQPARTVTVRLVYQGGTHRYHPKISADGKSWADLDERRCQVAPDKLSATLMLDATPRPLWVSAQEIVNSADIRAWLDQQAKHPFAKTEVIGHSAGGQAIPLLRLTEAPRGQAKTLIVLGRQHPPETTGTLALMAFVEAIANDSDLSRRFRARFETVVIPLINPDGVDDGHWRHNRHGVDLNRDWAYFRQPETRAVSEALARLKGQSVTFGIDFHSTFKDIFYTLLPATPVTTGPRITEDWIRDIAAAVPDYGYRVQAVTNEVPASLTWLNRTFGIDAVTYEVGDETPRSRLRQIAQVAAEKLMQRLLSEPRGN